MNNNLPFWPEWAVEEKLGQGTFGSVYRIRKRSAGSGSAEILSAMKVLRIPADPSEIKNLRNQGMGEASIRKLLQNDVKTIENEIRVMLSLASAAGVVTIEDYFIQELKDKVGWNVFIRMELLESLPDYLDRVGSITKEEVLKIGCDLCDALAACESVNIIHRDIKPANIFRNRFGQFKLGDFGIAKKMEGTYHASTRIGTPSYEAPEVFNRGEYDHTVDIYGLGMVLYTYLNKGRKPFYPPYPEELTRENMQEALQRRLNGEPIPPISGMDKKLYDIIGKACAFEPYRRYQSAAEVKEDLERYRSRRSETKERTDQRNHAHDIHFDDELTAQLEFKKKNSRVSFIAAGVIAALILVMGIFIGGWISGKSHRESEKKIAELSAMLTAKPEEVTEPTGTVVPEVSSTVTPEPTNTSTPEPTNTPTPEPISEGDIITFGFYEQDNNTSNGKEDIEWIVLAREDNRALLVSKYALDCREYNETYKAVKWDICTLRSWLNNTFISTAFTQEEQSKISMVTVKNADNPEYGTRGGNDTEDKVFLLSIDEMNRYFGSDEERKCVPTDYTIAQGVYTSDKYSADGRASCWYWLRSPGIKSNYADYVYYDGSVNYRGNLVYNDRSAVRPALWINLEPVKYIGEEQSVERNKNA